MRSASAYVAAPFEEIIGKFSVAGKRFVVSETLSLDVLGCIALGSGNGVSMA